MRRPISALLVLSLVAACASGQGRGAAPASEQEQEESALGTIASHAGGGALFGTALAAGMMQDCQGEGCAVGLLIGVMLIPVGAVIGAGVGLAKVAIANERDKAPAESPGEDACSDPAAADWLRECRQDQGAVPPVFSPSPDRSQAQRNPQFDAWFDGCAALLERRLDAQERRLVPAMCRSESVPSWWRTECRQKSAAAEEEARRARLLLDAERSRLERAGHCSLS
ncbi:MAG: hypothetical protein K0S81_2273 [Rhodospirillales bacterium]|jgi:hypothetical protein|nr:hypothetical protein [Rhodospirillales bacterium]